MLGLGQKERQQLSALLSNAKVIVSAEEASEIWCIILGIINNYFILFKVYKQTEDFYRVVLVNGKNVGCQLKVIPI